MTPLETLRELNKFFDTKEWDWEKFGDGPETYIGDCYKIWKHPKGLYECGSVKLNDTPKSLYRLLYLFGTTVDFSDMYKARVLVAASWDRQFAFEAYLFKYELGLYFYCTKEKRGGKGTGVELGHPGADNKIYCKDTIGNLWFRVAEEMLNHQWDVYPGNYFKV